MIPVAFARNSFSTKFGIPRQTVSDSVLVTRIVFAPEFRVAEALRGIEEFSHLWLIWGFSQFDDSDWSPTVRPPRLGGNVRVGVFATRSPNRPNHIALSSVRLLRVEDSPEGKVLVVQGADMLDGTPIYDIKPYIPYTDSHPDATGGFTDTYAAHRLQVEWGSVRLLDVVSRDEAESLAMALEEILSADPRPAYHDDPERVYGLPYAGIEVKFCVVDGVVHVLSAKKIKNVKINLHNSAKSSNFA